MLLTDANGPAFIEPTEIPTPTLEAVEEILVNEVRESSTSTEVQQPTSLAEATPVDTSSPSWIVLLFIVLALVGVGVYQMLKNKKDGKKKVAK